MTYRPILLLFAFAALAISAERGVAHPGMPHPTPSKSTDSVDVLLFSIPSIDSLDAYNTNVTADGRPVARGRVTIRSIGSSLLVGTIGAGSAVLTASAGRPMRLSAGRRVRSVAGTVRIASVRGALTVVARMGFPDYLAGTLAAESRRTDPREYRIALAVLQHNYAIAHAGRHAPDADVCDNTHCQLFRGTDAGPSEMRIVNAAASIERTDSSRPCYYSACCGGSTLTPLDVWGKQERGYARVACDGCGASRWFRWRSSVGAGDDIDREIAALPTPPFVDETAKIRLGRALGWNLVPSNTIDRVVRRKGRWIIEGRGFGHRVGLCQEGARRLATMGWSARRILDRYFPRIQ